MKRIIALLALLLWSISTAASASTGLSVLCVEKGGAISIEYSVGARCADHEGASLSTARQTSISDASCPNCIDRSLVPNAASSAPRVVSKAMAAEPAIAPLLVLTAPVFTNVNGVRAPPKIESALVQSAYLIQRPSIVILQ